MNILLLSDLHGEADRISRLRHEAEAADMLLIAGDITNFGGRAEAARVLETCSSLGLPLFLVHGNCDTAEAVRFIGSQEGALHLASRLFSGVRLAGIGGSLPGPVQTPSTLDEEDFEKELKGLEIPRDGTPLIFISHQPPHGTCADKVMKIRHIGSTAVARWSEKAEPLVHICGHIHESVCVGRMGKTVLVNPGSFRDGRYAVVRITGGKAEAELKNLS
jgi:Icc-related predicted phosphoesterase